MVKKVLFYEQEWSRRQNGVVRYLATQRILLKLETVLLAQHIFDSAVRNKPDDCNHHIQPKRNPVVEKRHWNRNQVK